MYLRLLGSIASSRLYSTFGSALCRAIIAVQQLVLLLVDTLAIVLATLFVLYAYILWSYFYFSIV